MSDAKLPTSERNACPESPHGRLRLIEQRLLQNKVLRPAAVLDIDSSELFRRSLREATRLRHSPFLDELRNVPGSLERLRKLLGGPTE